MASTTTNKHWKKITFPSAPTIFLQGGSTLAHECPTCPIFSLTLLQLLITNTKRSLYCSHQGGDRQGIAQQTIWHDKSHQQHRHLSKNASSSLLEAKTLLELSYGKRAFMSVRGEGNKLSGRSPHLKEKLPRTIQQKKSPKDKGTAARHRQCTVTEVDEPACFGDLLSRSSPTETGLHQSGRMGR